MLKEFAQYLGEQRRESTLHDYVDPEAGRIGPVVFKPGGGVEFLAFPPWPSLQVSTLQALATYIEADPDGVLAGNQTIVHIVDPWEVVVLDSANYQGRRRFVRALVPAPGDREDGFNFSVGEHLEGLHNVLHPDLGDFELLEGVLAAVRVTDESDLIDDGVAQRVTMRKGIELLEQQPLPRHFALAPRLSFSDVEPVLGNFRLRLRRTNRRRDSDSVEVHAELVPVNRLKLLEDAVAQVESRVRELITESVIIIR